jgi:glutamine amidotransferase
MKKIKILNYGNGNLGSLLNTFNSINYPSSVIKNLNEIDEADLLVLPGVGSAMTASETFKNQELTEKLNQRNANQKPILGICLGAQFFFEYMHESRQRGLAWVSGEVNEMKSFNTGWSQLDFESLKKYNLNKNLNKNDSFYFNHQYIFPNIPEISPYLIYDQKNLIPSIFLNDHLCGVQFHPEKSQSSGIKILSNILKIHYGI